MKKILQCPVNLDILKQELIKYDKLKDIESIWQGRLMNTGFSGAQLWQMEVRYTDGKTRFAVLKLAPDDSKNDLGREAAGFQKMQAAWSPDYLPQYCQKLETIPPGLLLDTALGSVIFSSYAHPRSTEIMTLGQGLEKNMAYVSPCLEKLAAAYLHETRITQQKSFSPNEHLRKILGDKKFEKIERWNWSQFGIDDSKPQVAFGGKVYANIIYCFRHAEAWDKGRFSIPYACLHGDLNLNNLLMVEQGKFVFIDFEKVDDIAIYYDLAFLLMWMIQICVLNRSSDKDWNDLLQLANYIGERLKIDKIVATPSFFQASFIPLAEKILNPFFALYNPTKDDPIPAENIRKGIRISLAAAALLRAFYELRSSQDGKEYENSALHRRSGLFFYALSCCVLKDEPRPMISETGGEIFELPVANEEDKYERQTKLQFFGVILVAVLSIILVIFAIPDSWVEHPQDTLLLHIQGRWKTELYEDWQPFTPATALHEGDLYQIEIESPQDMHLWAWQSDQSGRKKTAFPQAKDGYCFLAAQQSQTLPDLKQAFRLDAEPGIERIIFLCSKNAYLPDHQALLETMYQQPLPQQNPGYFRLYSHYFWEQDQECVVFYFYNQGKAKEQK